MRWGGVVVGLTLAACGGDLSTVDGGEDGREDLPAPRFEETCGQRGPVEILALEPNEYAYRIDADETEDIVFVGVFEADGPLGASPDRSKRRIVSVPSCGGEPAVVAEGMEYEQSFYGLDFACRVDGDGLYRIYGDASRSPTLVLDTCRMQLASLGPVAVLEGSGALGRLVFVPIAMDRDAPAETLADDIVVPINPFFGGSDYKTTPFWVGLRSTMVLNGAGEVLHVDLQDQPTEVVLDGALDFRASFTGNSIVWQADAPLAGDSDTPVSPVFLFNRETGAGTHLMDTHLAWSGPVFHSDWVVLRDDSSLGRRVFDLSGQELPLPSGTHLRAVLGPDSFWLSRNAGEMTEELYWEIGSEPRVVVAYEFGHPAYANDGIKVYVEDGHPATDEGSLLYGALAGGAQQVLSDRVSFYHRVFSDGRLLSVVDVDNNAHGQLRLEDPENGSVVEIDPYGYLHSPSLNIGDPFEGDIVWAVDDPEDGRHGLYRGRISGGVEPQ